MTPPELPVFGAPLQGIQLVEASAGTGKTWTLCALLLRLLLEKGLALNQILVVTFTKAATAELRERVRGRLEETRRALEGQAPAAGDPFVPELLARLRGLGHEDALLKSRLDLALHGFDEAAIFTIHGFAQRSLAELGFAAGLPTQLEALTDEAPLREELARAWWRREVVNGALPTALLQALQAESPEDWAQQLGRHLRLPGAEALWPAPLDAAGAAPPDPEPLRANLAARWPSERAKLFEMLSGSDALKKNIYSASALDKCFADWDALLAGPARLPEHDKATLLGSEKLQTSLKAGKTAPDSLFFADAQTLLDQLAAHAAHGQAQLQALRCRWLLDGAQQLANLKRERGLIGYDDMLGLLHERLQPPQGEAALALLQARYAAALVDEFQDTDPMQYRVFAALFPRGGGRAAAAPGRPQAAAPPSGGGAARSDAPGGCCFYVGDPKQAIYRFRQADLPTYLQARAEAEAVWTLSHNQRSVPELLAAFNAFFGRQPNAFLLPGLDYVPVQAGAKPKPLLHETTPSAPLQLWSWEADDGEDGGWPLLDAARQRALRACAHDIAQRLQADQLGDRPLQPGDIAVLVRTHRQAGRVAAALAAAGIESVALSQASVWRSDEAEELQLLLEALLGPRREPTQRAALATRLLGFDAPMLAALQTDEAAAQADAERWSRWRQDAATGPLVAALQRLLAEAGAAQRLLAQQQGERRLTNWLHLLELLQDAPAGASALRAWVRRQRHEAAGGSTNDMAQLRLESDARRVAIVTIHRSKGLEYPLVYCPFAFEGQGRDRSGNDWGRPRRDAAGQQQIDYRGGESDEAENAFRAAEDRAEELRLHYVALTRAVQRCVLVVGPYRTKSGKGFSDKPSLGAALHHFALGREPASLDELDAAWSAPLPHTAFVRLAANPPAPPPLPAPARPALAARSAPEQLPPLRWTGSFSRLVLPHAQGAALGEPPAELPPEDFLRFPRGSRAGDCLHAALERVDLGAPASWAPAINAALALHPPAPEPDPLWPAQLQQALQRAAHTPLAGGLRLSSGPRALREWGFQLHAPAVDLHALRALLQAQGLALPGLRGHHLRGFLRGFVDLVVEHQGRFWVMDWKSNHLGHRAADYAPAALAPVVAAHGYALQALLYLLALHRHLRASLPGYAPAQHLGGAQLLFLRGLDAEHGQFTLPADAPLLNAMDALDALFS